MLGNADVGLFAAAVRISEALYFLPLAVAASVAPALTAARAGPIREYEQRFLQVTRLLVFSALAVAVCFTLFSKPIILTLYGTRFAAAAPVLSVHTWAGVLVSLGVCSNLWLVNEGHLKYTMYQTLLGAATNIVLNLFLIPRMGVIGAAFASCAGQFVAVTLTVAIAPKTRRLSYLQLASFVPAPLNRPIQNG
jgi:PST family polysaccharide transporter